MEYILKRRPFLKGCPANRFSFFGRFRFLLYLHLKSTFIYKVRELRYPDLFEISVVLMTVFNQAVWKS